MTPPFGSELVTEAPSVRMSAVEPRLPLDTKFVPVQVGIALVIHFGDARGQRSQRDHLAINQRQVIDELAIDDLASFRIFSLNGLRFCRDLDSLVGAGYLQGKVGGCVFVDVQP